MTVCMGVALMLNPEEEPTHVWGFRFQGTGWWPTSVPWDLFQSLGGCRIQWQGLLSGQIWGEDIWPPSRMNRPKTMSCELPKAQREQSLLSALRENHSPSHPPPYTPILPRCKTLSLTCSCARGTHAQRHWCRVNEYKSRAWGGTRKKARSLLKEEV